ncbi:MAG: dihydroorotate dehydrogenase electron transfer subunit [Planctomycetota bacterium]
MTVPSSSIQTAAVAVQQTAACYADAAHFKTVRVVSNTRIAERTHRIRIECPEIAAAALPGQFSMLRIPDRNDPLLARPLAIYETFSAEDDREPVGAPAGRRFVDFIYLVHGKFTTALQEIAAGSQLIVWGPLGNGFAATAAADHLVLVAGGIGQTALLAFGRERLGGGRYGLQPRSVPAARRVTLCWGARTAAMFGAVDDFHAAGIDVHLATLDGSTGRRGTVIDLLDDLGASLNDSQAAASTLVACCGPEGMMAAVSRWTAERRIRCQVSLEAPMACGVGICFTCVARVRDPLSGGWDYRRTCVEGPIFDASTIVWD